MLTKSARYFYDAEAIKEKAIPQERTGIIGYAVPKHEALRVERNRQFNSDKSTLNSASGTNRNKRSVWTVATAPYPEAHFATYPPDLIKPCILAGTSSKGCCAKCGSPWERVTETTSNQKQENWTGSGRDNGCPAGGGHFGRTGQWSAESKTIGWQPTCICDVVSAMLVIGEGGGIQAIPETSFPPDANTIPCAVIDPFAGSGTTGAVALELGRSATLIELNPKYVELIEARCNITPGLALAV